MSIDLLLSAWFDLLLKFPQLRQFSAHEHLGSMHSTLKGIGCEDINSHIYKLETPMRKELGYCRAHSVCSMAGNQMSWRNVTLRVLSWTLWTVGHARGCITSDADLACHHHEFCLSVWAERPMFKVGLACTTIERELLSMSGRLVEVSMCWRSDHVSCDHALVRAS